MTMHAHQVFDGTADAADDPRNALLVAFDAMVEAMVDNGLEAQLLMRLPRLLPSLGKQQPSAVPAALPPSAFIASAEDELQAQIAISALKACEKLKLNGHAHHCIARAKGWLERQLEAAKHARAA